MIKALFLWAYAFMGGAVFADTPPSSPPPAADATYLRPSYFFTVDLDPRYQFVGTGALTEEDAATANCYRFTYNLDGKLRQIEYLRAGRRCRTLFSAWRASISNTNPASNAAGFAMGRAKRFVPWMASMERN